jgi:hypothetical protein
VSGFTSCCLAPWQKKIGKKYEKQKKYGPSHVIRGIREIDIPTILSRVFFEYACAVIVLLITVRGVIIIIVCLIVVVIERPR